MEAWRPPKGADVPMGAERLLLDRTMAALSKAASATFLRQQVIAANIANLETPGYKARYVQFEQALAAALDAERRGCGVRRRLVELVQPRIRPRPSPALRWDGNNVSPERELVALAQSALQHNAIIRMLAHKFKMLKIAITGRS